MTYFVDKQKAELPPTASLEKNMSCTGQQFEASVPFASEQASFSKRDCGLRRANSSAELRHTSDSNLYGFANKRGSWGRSRSSKDLYGSKNEEFALQPGASLCIAQRAGAGGIRAVIANIELKSLKVDEDSPSSFPLHDGSDDLDTSEESRKGIYDPPTAECKALSQWSSDPYYRAVISTSGGITAVLQAMRAYPHSAELQLAACTALKNLSGGSVSIRKVICAAGGKDAVVDAAKNHPDCVEIQGALEAILQTMEGA